MKISIILCGKHQSQNTFTRLTSCDQLRRLIIYVLALTTSEHQTMALPWDSDCPAEPLNYPMRSEFFIDIGFSVIKTVSGLLPLL